MSLLWSVLIILAFGGLGTLIYLLATDEENRAAARDRGWRHPDDDKLRGGRRYRERRSRRG